MKKLILSVLGVLTLVACGAPSGLDGKVAGHEFHAKDAVLITQTIQGASYTSIALTDFENACESFKANRVPKDSKLVLISLANMREDGAPLPVSTGEFTLGRGGEGRGKIAGAQFASLDESCENTIPYNQSIAQSGLVKVDSFELGEGATGTFDATFGDQKDKVSGWFNATHCSGNISFVEPSCE